MSSLRQWVNSTGSIYRKESDYLESADICAIGISESNGINLLKSIVEKGLIYLMTLRAEVRVTTEPFPMHLQDFQG